ncbi:putative cyclin-dependent protein kinase complex component protein [Botrytis fragariae]|uniref:Putative cyclin-dependent protein kinase complex component protein n=1 Tax=Botrytis fragariae TaxID=1964551 RepID=A0A8H6B338_9HELO|nr:putative cyclin-dependent protein kinase complex component protein [Botrytis fragariae]KAF5878137.1 putative cyclin-dependent protein kinase complex component protein [Botrytis fragariae]
MAAVIDFVSDSSRFHPHTMIPAAGHHGSSEDSPYRQPSRSRVEPPPSPNPHPTSVDDGTPPPSADIQAKYDDSHDVDHRTRVKPEPHIKSEPISPPSSSSPNSNSHTQQQFQSQQNFPPSSAPHARAEHSHTLSTDSPLRPRMASGTSERTIPRSAKSLDDVQNYGGNTIKVRDLAHIESFASPEFLSSRGQIGDSRTADEPGLKYEISGMPITDIIEMVAGLLTKITTTNDRQHETLQRSIPSAENTANLTGLSSSVLAFHGKNVPSITILSYLTRIHKYCPTTYEVFLSLLVYFDRMTERVNAEPINAMRQEAMDLDGSRPSSTYSAEGSDLADTPPGARSVPELKSEFENAQYSHSQDPEPGLAQFPLSHFFVVDSFNIHRLVIAGVTCASKFFSDVFYTNSRYAKVGGLPLNELNHLELQFLLLNDFRLSVPVEVLEAYGTMLVDFYAREIVDQKRASGMTDMAYKQETAS